MPSALLLCRGKQSSVEPNCKSLVKIVFSQVPNGGMLDAVLYRGVVLWVQSLSFRMSKKLRKLE